MNRKLKSRDELLDAMSYVFLYAADPTKLDLVEQQSFRGDIVSILHRIEEEIAQSAFDIQKNWFTSAKEKVATGLALFDQRQFDEASQLLAQAEDIFRSGISAHQRRTDFVVGADGVATKTP